MHLHAQRDADALLSLLRARFGDDPRFQSRLRPVLIKVLAGEPRGESRRRMLRLVVECYARHVRLRKAIARTREKLRRRINELYASMIGISPPDIGA
ncbi:MAG: hypothetical protein ACREID_01400 [Planctomycetota bacterium]